MVLSFFMEKPRAIDEGGEDLNGAVLSSWRTPCRWSYYLREGPELRLREERISIVQSFFMNNFSEGGPTT